MVHLDTFSGLGLFALAAQHVWGRDYRTHSFIEIDPFCRKWLKANFKGIPIHDDADTYRHDGTAINLLTGGFPCQTVSVAGQRKGNQDDRWKWPAQLRIIQDARPESIILENVSNLVNFDRGLLLDGILADLENEEYEVLPPFILPACSQNAPHRRDRIFIVAYSPLQKTTRQQQQRMNRFRETSTNHLGNPNNTGRREQRRTEPVQKEQPSTEHGSGGDNVGDTDCERSQIRTGKTTEAIQRINTNYRAWDSFDWITGHDGKQRRIPPAESGICLLADGYPHRNDLLRAFGNGIVWQAVIPIMKAIKDYICDSENTRRNSSRK